MADPIVNITVAPVPEAAASLAAKTPVGVQFSTDELAQLPLALRESAFFSAKVEEVRYLQHLQDQLNRKLNLQKTDRGVGVNRATFIADAQALARDLGVKPADPSKVGTIQDPASFARLKLIYDIQTQRAAEYARWLRDQDPTRLEFYPCYELVRKETRIIPRDWQARFLAAGGKLYQGRMIAPKNDPIWTALSRFETPWPPFDFNSGMGLRDISRKEAVDLGVITKDQVIQPGRDGFNDTLQASVKTLNPEYRTLLKETFGDQIKIDADTAQWQSNVIADLVSATRPTLFLGVVPTAAARAATAAGLPDLTGYVVSLDRSALPPGLTLDSAELVPFVAREPDTILPGSEPGTVVFEKTLLGKIVRLTFSLKSKTLVLTKIE